MVSLPIWLAALLGFFYVLGTFLAGLGAMLSSRTGNKVESITLTLNGELQKRLDAVYKLGHAEGELKGQNNASVTPVVVVNPLSDKDNDT